MAKKKKQKTTVIVHETPVLRRVDCKDVWSPPKCAEAEKQLGHATAFPYSTFNGKDNIVVFNPGLTKREWFAGMAMAGLLANSTEQIVTSRHISRWAVAEADALLRELTKCLKAGDG